MPARVRDDRPMMDRIKDMMTRHAPNDAESTRDDDVELSMPKGGKRDPRLPPDVPSALRQALAGGKQFNAAVEGLRKRAK